MSRDVARRAAEALRSRDQAPDAVAVAPGRVNLIGGHTDYNDGLVLPVAIDRHVAVAAKARSDDELTAVACDYDESAATTLDALSTGEPTWFDYVQGVAATLPAYGFDVSGASLAIAGSVPQGAGLASSAALEVAVARALLAVAGDRDPDPEAVAEACHAAENDFVGVSCGIMDQYAASFTRPGHALALDCRDRTIDHVPMDPDAARIVVVDTNVSHELVDSAYNERTATCARAADLLDEVVDRPVTSLRDVTIRDIQEHGDHLSDDERRRAVHVVHENARVAAAATALREGDLDTLGTLLFASHASLRELYEVSCAELDFLVDVAEATPGVFGARMTGAGFGGCVVSLVAPDAVDAFTDAVRAQYPAEFGLDPDVFVCEPAAGADLVGLDAIQ